MQNVQLPFLYSSTLRDTMSIAEEDALMHEPSSDVPSLSRKFGKHIQKRQLDIPEYAASFVDYKALKKVCSPSNVLSLRLF